MGEALLYIYVYAAERRWPRTNDYGVRVGTSESACMGNLNPVLVHNKSKAAREIRFGYHGEHGSLSRTCSHFGIPADSGFSLHTWIYEGINKRHKLRGY